MTGFMIGLQLTTSLVVISSYPKLQDLQVVASVTSRQSVAMIATQVLS